MVPDGSDSSPCPQAKRVSLGYQRLNTLQRPGGPGCRLQPTADGIALALGKNISSEWSKVAKKRPGRRFGSLLRFPGSAVTRGHGCTSRLLNTATVSQPSPVSSSWKLRTAGKRFANSCNLNLRGISTTRHKGNSLFNVGGISPTQRAGEEAQAMAARPQHFLPRHTRACLSGTGSGERWGGDAEEHRRDRSPP